MLDPNMLSFFCFLWYLSILRHDILFKFSSDISAYLEAVQIYNCCCLIIPPLTDIN